MKRLIVFLVFLLAVGGGLLWYFVFRLTPEKALQKALQNLSAAQTVQTMQASVYWDLRSPSGQGFVLDKWLSFAGSVDLKDLTRPKISGVAGYSRTGRGDDFQSLDIVVVPDRAAFRLREVSTGTEEYVRTMAATTTADRWFFFDRDTLLDKSGNATLRSIGNGSDIRAALKASDVPFAAILSGAATESVENGRSVIRMPVRVRSSSLEGILLSLTGAWQLRNPNPSEVSWVKRSAAGASQGTWHVSIDRNARTFRTVQATWPLVDDNGRETGHVTVDLAFGGWEQPLSISVPADAVDLTGRIVQTGLRTFSPAEIRQGEVFGATSTVPAAPRQDAYDVYGQYLEQIRKRRQLY